VYTIPITGILAMTVIVNENKDIKSYEKKVYRSLNAASQLILQNPKEAATKGPTYTLKVNLPFPTCPVI
jgi:hypothetical protein